MRFGWRRYESKVWTLGCFAREGKSLNNIGWIKKLANLIGVIDSKEEDRKLLQIEVETMEEYNLAMSLGFKHILLDNFSIRS